MSGCMYFLAAFVLDVVSGELHDCVWNVGMFIVSKVEHISSATVIVRAGGAIWLNPFSMVLFNVYSAVTVECCFVPMLRGCLLYVCCYVRKKALL